MANVVGRLIVDLVADASGYEDDLKQAEGKTKSWAQRISGVATTALKVGVVGAATTAAAAVGAIGVAAFNVSRDTEQAAADMAASLGVPMEAAQGFAEVARQVYGNNFTDSVTAAAAAVGEVAKQMQLAADNPALQRITEQAVALNDTFGVDVTESVAAAKQLMADFGLTSDQAFEFITAGYQRGLDASGDFLDSVTEYSTQFANGGADAGQFFSLMETGLQSGVLGTDKAADAFKEFRLRIVDGSSTTAAALGLIGLNADEMAAAIDSGAMTSADAFALVTQKLAETDDASVRMQAGAGLLGTQFEDLGDSAVAALSLTSTQMSDLVGSTDALNNKYQTFGDRATAIWRKITVAVSPLTDKLLQMAEDAMPAVEAKIDELTPVIINMAGQIGPLVERIGGWIERWNSLSAGTQKVIGVVAAVVAAIVPLMAVLGPLITIIGTVATVAGAVAPVLGVVGAALTALTGPIGLVVLAVVALVAAWRSDFLGLRTHTLSALEGIKTGFQNLTTNVRSRWQQFSQNLTTTTQNALQRMQSLWQQHNQRVPEGVRQQMSVLRGIFQSGFEYNRQIVMAGMSFMRGDFDGGMQHLQQAGQAGLDALRGVFRFQFDNIRNVVQFIDWHGVGTAIVQGIANGITGGAGAIVNAAQQAAQQALQAARNFLGINSPSAVAAEQIGQPIAEGIGVGMGDGLNDLTRTIGSGLNAMIGGIAPAGASPGGVSINVTQYFGDGADRAAVAMGAQDGLLAGLRQAGLR